MRVVAEKEYKHTLAVLLDSFPTVGKDARVIRRRKVPVVCTIVPQRTHPMLEGGVAVLRGDFLNVKKG